MKKTHLIWVLLVSILFVSHSSFANDGTQPNIVPQKIDPAKVINPSAIKALVNGCTQERSCNAPYYEIGTFIKGCPGKSTQDCYRCEATEEYYQTYRCPEGFETDRYAIQNGYYCRNTCAANCFNANLGNPNLTQNDLGLCLNACPDPSLALFRNHCIPGATYVPSRFTEHDAGSRFLRMSYMCMMQMPNPCGQCGFVAGPAADGSMVCHRN